MYLSSTSWKAWGLQVVLGTAYLFTERGDQLRCHEFAAVRQRRGTRPAWFHQGGLLHTDWCGARLSIEAESTKCRKDRRLDCRLD